MGMKRKKINSPEPYESAGVPHDSHAKIYESMVLSEAYQDLTKNQQHLYTIMKLQRYGKRKPGSYAENEGISELQGEDKFFFNRALAVKKYKLYGDKNRTQFYKDIHALIEHGLIEVVSEGKPNHKKSIYKYSSKWKYWKAPP